ncbi:uncharacterized protein EV420DRAFT_5956 [Desarmillaria tabescens]|uniref:Uncharacterized protein n=1 Tax=Armillaria tabescens TaxID=1929756 RepID=A0AA39NP42_ARMTA|nr:uncharacterized protein EV420DRAFT_5956 [Desarmillaria tabescens]KAK0469054.1 hypothetical protein EV420DRAFT_5956 [Desarmillaria tabescens]
MLLCLFFISVMTIATLLAADLVSFRRVPVFSPFVRISESDKENRQIEAKRIDKICGSGEKKVLRACISKGCVDEQQLLFSRTIHLKNIFPEHGHRQGYFYPLSTFACFVVAFVNTGIKTQTINDMSLLLD